MLFLSAQQERFRTQFFLDMMYRVGNLGSQHWNCLDCTTNSMNQESYLSNYML